MLEELPRSNYAESTIHTYIHTIEHFGRHFHRSPDQLGPENIRQYQAALFTHWKLAPNTVTQRLAALRFFYVQVLKRGWSVAETPYPKSVGEPTCITVSTTIFLLCHNRFLVHKMARTNPSRKPAFMTQDSRAAEKPGGSTPSLSEDSRTMLSLISLHFKEKPRLAPNLRYWVVFLAPVLLVCLAPFAVLLFILKNNIRPHYASLDLLPVFAGCWAIFAVWITLHKGMGSLLLGEDTAGAAWLLLGLVNVIAAFGTLLVLCIS